MSQNARLTGYVLWTTQYCYVPEMRGNISTVHHRPCGPTSAPLPPENTLEQLEKPTVLCMGLPRLGFVDSGGGGRQQQTIPSYQGRDCQLFQMTLLTIGHLLALVGATYQDRFPFKG